MFILLGDAEALKGLSFYWSTPSLASWLSASLVLETWSAFRGNGPLPPFWPGRAVPPAQSCLSRKGEGFESPDVQLWSRYTLGP